MLRVPRSNGLVRRESRGREGAVPILTLFLHRQLFTVRAPPTGWQPSSQDLHTTRVCRRASRCGARVGSGALPSPRLHYLISLLSFSRSLLRKGSNKRAGTSNGRRERERDVASPFFGGGGGTATGGRSEGKEGGKKKKRKYISHHATGATLFSVM